ncbi:choline/ethanolamine transporter flvcr2a-like [Parasteatoda tepidariorum]|uniref:choline/ethanolamine transporter flvcr2a-like n=1 Tax=Parasteatoda tepidariorum TaxID=114398 RepID=UPI001C71DB9F|nr:feline leukemia virus subgroup C receptor-related protein 2-like [Parasteatoda tepidariorum]
MVAKFTSKIDPNAANFDQNCNTTEIEIKVYKRRFWMLFLFSFLSFLCGLLYTQYVAMADMNTCYYGVSNHAVNWTSMMFMVVYLVLVFPTSSIIDRIDLRKTVILGSLFNTIGCALQFCGLKPNGFPFVLLSTFVCSLSNLILIGIPPFVATKWFPSNELSRACAVGVFGNQLGIGVAFILSPMLVTSDCKKKGEIEEGKSNVALILTVLNTALLILILLTFQSAPQHPPNQNELQKISKKPTSRVKTILKMLKNVHFILIIVVYGMMCGSYMAFATTLNDLILRYFPKKQIEVGWMGLIFIATGLVGSIIAGWILDSTRKYKETYLGICTFSLVLYVVFSIQLFIKLLWLQFLMIGLLGFFLTSLLPIGFEYGIEVTYPDSEVISGNLLMTSTNLFGLILTEIISTILDTKGPIWSNVFICIIFFISCIISSFITRDYKRTKDNEKKLECRNEIFQTNSSP